ncbi:retron St85 family effector protein [Palleronia caenipelagi]|uniref:Uncharacterized protein n=1 Tax=Palleronia caenipelagi TaxID=2489174 RepID=A0A547PKE1_9RHOB|nr:retron St85 family effector protein [Palleronia caenipelagi]TRD14609.1 hypothetical protein FEV53_18670 [Palleronia caenipelagi]
MSGAASDPRDDIAAKISLKNCRIRSKPHYVFVCGGKVDVTSTANLSVRNMMMNSTAAQEGVEFVLAESYKDWFDGYDDLAEFENDIAGLASVVAVILESPGSLAELGLFYANEHIRTKLFAVLNRGFYIESSFIKHGILAPLETLDQRFVLPLDLNPDNADLIELREVEEIVHEVTSYLDTLPDSEAFTIDNHGHVLLLIFQIIHLFLALTFNEILTFLEKSGVTLSEKRLKAGLYILERFGLVGMEKRASQKFYFAKSNAPTRVEIRAQKGAPVIDLSAAKIKISQHYRKQSASTRREKNRVYVIENFVISGEGG